MALLARARRGSRRSPTGCLFAGRLLAACALLAILSAPRAAALGIAPDHPASTAEIAAICDKAGAMAAQATGVPLEVLSAISLTETGRRIDGRSRAWPWTVNMEGKGVWFATPDEALTYVNEHFARGARSFDVGCFQINYRWHGNAFSSIEEMFDPARNALYAAQYLRNLYAETGSWSRAAGAYHSRTPQYADRYRARFDRILASLSGGDIPPPAPGEYDPRLAAGSEPILVAEDDPPSEPREPWVPPPPTRFGSVAGIEAAGGSGSLLLRANGSLF